jgi:NADH-quinone oxidoreductase subunit D
MRRAPLGPLRRELLGVRGLGPETADAILLYAAGRPVFVADAYTRRVLERHADMPNRVTQYEALVDRNEIFLQRTKNVGIVSRERLLELGVTGPLLRASGEPWDLRKVNPYLAYGDVDFKVPVGTVGDGYDRYRCRMAEMRESVRIIEQCLDGLPEGPYIADDRKVVLPPRHELGTSMEALIHHFKLVTEGFRVPPGEVYYPIEGPRGELGCYVLADGSAKPARVHFRDPSFVNLQALRDMCVGGYVADLIQNLGMLDPILGGVDR